MDSILKKGLFLVAVTGGITAFPIMAQAADIDDTQDMPTAGIEQVLGECYTSEKTISVKDYLVPTQKGEYLDMAFANVQSFLYIRSEPTTESEWVGKLYPDYAAKIIGPVGEWTKVQSGNVTGYVYSECITVGNEEVNLKIAKISDQSPLDANRYTFSGTFLVSDEFMDKLKDYGCYSAYVNASNAEEFCKKLDEEETRLAKEGIKLNYTNYKEEAEQQNKMVLLISIFLYGFIIVITLIGVTNIFNTITTNMNLRSKEFAMLKSIGMTKKEFDKMINLESIFYGVKSLIIGVALGSGISYWIYKISIGSQATENLKFVYPTKAVIISVVFIAVIVGIIMRYSLNKINKQNIIETIRNDNI